MWLGVDLTKQRETRSTELVLRAQDLSTSVGSTVNTIRDHLYINY